MNSMYLTPLACPSPPTLRNMSGDAMSCFMPSSCSAVRCCLDVSRLSGQSVEVSLDFSQCGNYLDITVEKITVKHYLNSFTFGMMFTMSASISLSLSLKLMWGIALDNQILYIAGVEHKMSLRGMFEVK